MACGEITLGSVADCANLPAGGTRARAIVFNYDDIASYTEVGGKITSINLEAAKYGYEFTGLGNSFKKSEAFNRSASKCLSLSCRNCWKQVCISATRRAAGIPRCGVSSSPNAPASTSSICRRPYASSKRRRSCCATSC